MVEANNLQKSFLWDAKSEELPISVSLVHNDTIIMFLNMDQRLYLTIPILKLAEMKEEGVALLLAHELAHFVLDHQVNRVGKAIFNNKLMNKLFFKNAGFKDVYDPTRVEFKEKVIEKQKYSCFYP